MRFFIITDLKTAGVMLTVFFLLSSPLISQKMKITIDYPEWQPQRNLIGSSFLESVTNNLFIQSAQMNYEESKLFVKDSQNRTFVENINQELTEIYGICGSEHIIWGTAGSKILLTNACANAGPFLSISTCSLVNTPAGTFWETRNLNYNIVTGEKLNLDRMISPERYENIMQEVRTRVRNSRESFTKYNFPIFESAFNDESWNDFNSFLQTARINSKSTFTFTNDSIYIFLPVDGKLLSYSNYLIIQIPFSELKSYAAEGSPIEYFNNLQSVWGKIKSSFGPLWFDATKSALEEHVQKESSTFYTVAQLPDYARSEIESYFPGKDFSAVKIYKSVPLNSHKTKIGVINTITDLLGGVKPAAQTFGNNIYFEDFEPGRLEDRRTLLHELVHVIQYSKLGYKGFRDAYVKAVAGGMSYYQIPLEIEAYNFTGH